MDKYEDNRVHAFGTFLAGENQDTLLYKFCEWFSSKQKRTVKIKLDPWDTWNMDGTLSLIILPMLIQLKEIKHGAPFVDDSDVPWYLGSTIIPKKEEWDTDDNHFKRWDWVLDELIWTFKQLQPEYDWEQSYHHGKIDFGWEPIKNGFYEMFKGPKDTSWWDKDGYMKHQEKITNGLRLFGKYYQNLWD
jgi:hypothetical protein